MPISINPRQQELIDRLRKFDWASFSKKQTLTDEEVLKFARSCWHLMTEHWREVMFLLREGQRAPPQIDFDLGDED